MQDYLSLNFAWAVGVAMGVWVSGGISGGHINPAVGGRQTDVKVSSSHPEPKGHIGFCDLPGLPVEESSCTDFASGFGVITHRVTDIHLCPNFWGLYRCCSCLCKLFPCHRHHRGRTWSTHTCYRRLFLYVRGG